MVTWPVQNTRPISVSAYAKTLLAGIVTVSVVALAANRAVAQNIPGYVVLPLTPMFQSNQATIRVSVNGQKTMLMLDTGATGTLLDRQFYSGAHTATANIKRQNLPPELQKGVSANGERAEIGYIDDLKAGPMDFGGSPVVITDLSSHFGRYNASHQIASIAGLLGEDFLHKYAAIIDWGRRGVYFNTDPSRRLKMGPGLVAAGWTAVPMAPTNARHFTVQSAVEGKNVRLIVDTGAQFTSFVPGIVPLTMIYGLNTGPSMSRLIPTTGTMKMIGLDATMHPARIEHWKIGNYEVPSSIVAVNKFPPTLLTQQSAGEGPILGLLGCEVLARNHAIIDIAGSTIYLKSK